MKDIDKSVLCVSYLELETFAYKLVRYNIPIYDLAESIS